MAEETGGVLPTDKNSNPVQVLGEVATVADDIDGVSDRIALPSGASEGTIIRVAANTDCYIAFGTISVTASSSDMLFINGVEYLQVPAGAGYIAYIQVSAAGRISISLMA